MTTRDQNAALAKETLQSLENGMYEIIGSDHIPLLIHIDEALVAAKEGSVCYGIQDIPRPALKVCKLHMELYVLNADCISVARAMASSGLRTMVLNFASAKNPGYELCPELSPNRIDLSELGPYPHLAPGTYPNPSLSGVGSCVEHKHRRSA